jgi:fructose-1,6-bisphosphatase I
MGPGSSLEACLSGVTPSLTEGLARTVTAIAEAARDIAALVALGPLVEHSEAGGRNADGDAQTALDLDAHQRVTQALRQAPVAFVASEEAQEPVLLDPGAPLAVAVDPLDGSSNIDSNVSIGTIFSVRPALAGEPLATFLRPGSGQLAAGFVIYGPQTALALSVGQGVQIYVLERARGTFSLALPEVRVPATANEYAINASNYWHWDEGVRAYIDDCMQGEEGPRGKSFNMRWIASLVADAYRILRRGGVFLYPADRRPGYHQGRLRLVYEANPIAFLMEQAGGAATDGLRRVLEIAPAALHQRTPLVFGSSEKVARVARYQEDPHFLAGRSPLFGRRGLMLA